MIKNILIAFSFSVLTFLLAVPATLASETTPVKEATLAESEIPLKIAETTNAAAQTGQSGKLILTLLVLVGMFAAAYYLIKKYAYSNKINKSNMQIKVLSQHHLGAKKSLAIIRVAGESILIGVTDQNISMIKSLALIDDEIPAEVSQKPFAKNLTDLEATDADQLASMAQMNEQEIEDEFSFSGLKTNVSKKLKSMRTFQ